MAAELDAIPGLRQKLSGHYAGLPEIVAEHFQPGTREALLVAFLNREGFGEPWVPKPGAQGLPERGTYVGDEIAVMRENVRRRQETGTSLSGAGFGRDCRFAGRSMYRVRWRSENGSIAEIFAGADECFVEML
ncbi:MAG: hypothetical protein AAGE76_07690 [Pseudomonadota bacterium]